MGIINVNSDSFYAGSRAQTIEAVCKRTEEHIRAGAQFIDIGACSTRPGASTSQANEEWTRLSGIFSRLRKEFPSVYLSVDTYWSEVAENSVNEGADFINDVSAGSIDVNLLTTVARLQVPYVLTHMQGIPSNMQNNPHYEHVNLDVLYFLAQKQKELYSMGCRDVIVDPGFGFGKTLDHNYSLLKHLDEIITLKAPVIIGVSRKSMITQLLNLPTSDALNGTTALHMLALIKGAHILRVHDAMEAAQCIAIMEAYKAAN